MKLFAYHAFAAAASLMLVATCASPNLEQCASGLRCPTGFVCKSVTLVDEETGMENTEEHCVDPQIGQDCGDGVRDPGEQCDCGVAGSETRYAACGDLNNAEESGYCNESCVIHCGDGEVDMHEACDTRPRFTCVDAGYDTGHMLCASGCSGHDDDRCGHLGWINTEDSLTRSIADIWIDDNTLFVIGEDGLAKKRDLNSNDWSDMAIQGLGEDDDDRRLYDLVALWGTNQGLYAVGAKQSDVTPPVPPEAVVLHSPQGSEWVEMANVDSEIPPGERLRAFTGVWADSANEVYVTGGTQPDMMPEMASGAILKFNGTAWSLEELPQIDPMTGYSGADINGIWGPGDGQVFAITDAGEILHKPDNGSWQLSNLMIQAGGRLTAISGIPANSGGNTLEVFAAGSGLDMFRYNGSEWRRMDGYPASDGFVTDIWGIGPRDLVAVRDDGSILRFDGDFWFDTRSGVVDALSGVAAKDAETIVAVGEDGLMLRLQGWLTRPTELNEVYDILGVQDDPEAPDVTLYAVGQPRPSQGTQALSGIHRLESNDRRWIAEDMSSLQAPPPAPPVEFTIRALWRRSDGHMYAVGELPDPITPYLIVQSRAGETTWEPMQLQLDMAAPPPMGEGGLNALWGIEQPDGSFVLIAVGINSTILRLVGNRNDTGPDDLWRPMFLPASDGGKPPLRIDLFSVWGTAEDNIYAVGEAGALLHYTSTDPMEPWTIMPTSVLDPDGPPPDGQEPGPSRITEDGVYPDLFYIWGVGPDDMYIVGALGTLMKFDPVEQMWTRPESAGLLLDRRDELFRLWGYAPTNITAVGADGVMFHFNGGDWTDFRPQTAAELTSIWGPPDPVDVVFVGDSAGKLHKLDLPVPGGSSGM